MITIVLGVFSCLLLSLVVPLAAQAAPHEPLDIGSRLELFVDDYLIAELQGVELKLHSPVPREVALSFADVPWEGTVSFYPTVMRDGYLYRAYYRGKPASTPDSSQDEVTCYAESLDGIHWTRPRLGLFEIMGTRENNVVLDNSYAPVPLDWSPFLDTRPGVPAQERYKSMGGHFYDADHLKGRVPDSVLAGYKYLGGLFGFKSADGIRWEAIAQQPLITPSHFPLVWDSGGTHAFWSETEGRYVCYLRIHRKSEASERLRTGKGRDTIRWIGRTTSPDFLNWSQIESLDFGSAPDEELYTNAIVPYFRAPHIYLGFAKRILPARKAVQEHPLSGVSDGVFMSSRDGVRFRRPLEAFLRPGRDRKNWTERNNAIAVGVVPTAADELSLYWIENYRHPSCRLRRGTLRLDGFVSAHAGYQGGELLTHPLRFKGSKLVLNYATSAAGSIRVELQEANGTVIPGYALEQSPELYGDQIGRVFGWQKGSDVSSLVGRLVRLRFVMRDADLYSLRFK